MRAIRLPLEQANRLAARIAQGDLSQDIISNRSDEFGEVMQSLSRMNESLAVMVAQVRTGTVSIALASAEIASAAIANLDQITQKMEYWSSKVGLLRKAGKIRLSNWRRRWHCSNFRHESRGDDGQNFFLKPMLRKSSPLAP